MSTKASPAKKVISSKKETEEKKVVVRSKPNLADPKFTTFIRRVLSQVHPETGITDQAIHIVEELCQYILAKLMVEMNIIMNHDPKRATTYSSRHVQTAIRLFFPGELAKHGVADGTKAHTKFVNSTVAGSRSLKAGLQFPVSRIESAMRKRGADRIGAGAPVFMAGALEYICAEILELAGNATRDNKKVRIKPRFIVLAIRTDDELDNLFKDCMIAGGVLAHIPREILPKRLADMQN